MSPSHDQCLRHIVLKRTTAALLSSLSSKAWNHTSSSTWYIREDSNSSHKLMKTVSIPKNSVVRPQFGTFLQTHCVKWKKHPRMKWKKHPRIVVFENVSFTAFLAAVSKSIIQDSGVSTDWRSFTADF